MSSPAIINLRKRVARASTKPGVYRWLDADGTIIYVGKAKNLRNRLKSYVMESAAKGQGPWKQSMYQQLADFDVTVTNSELEALILETNLIKEIRPKYNVLMKDDKNYVYVEVTMKDPYPRVEVVRKMESKSAKYFGPFLSPYEVKKTLEMLHDFFAFRACETSVNYMNKRVRDSQEEKNEFSNSPIPGALKPCLDSQIGQCNGLCAGIVSQEEYRRRIEEVIRFFKGDYGPVIARGKELMGLLATQKKFERAARIRDTLAMIEHMKERQLVSDTSGDDVDVVGVALLSNKAHVEVMQKRAGKLIGEHHLSLMGNAESIGDVIEQFLPQYYEGVADLPDTILVGEEFESRDALAALLTQTRGKKVEINIPERGHKSQLLELAETNAQEKAKQAEATWEAEQRNIDNALEELTRELDLEKPPARIEGYDISHSGGTETVGSMVVFVNGKAKNDQYRSFTIHTMASGVVDDYRALREVLTRRLRHVAGGYKMEEAKWEEGGITLGKARKEEQGAIEEIIARHPDDLSGRDIDYKAFTVARHENDIIGFVRLRDWKNNHTELSSLWVDETYRGGKLGHFLARSVLRSVKKGKVYVFIHPELEQYYASLGFRHVIKMPQVFLDRWEAVKKERPDAVERMVLVYDTVQHKPDSSLSSKPDLLVIDGGKGQLSTVVDVLTHMQLTIPVIGLAKREEEVFLPGQSVSIVLSKDSPAKFMLMRLRDEAHRFANYHRKKRISKHAIESQLDRVPGIGPETKQQLFKAFGSVENIRRQPDDALSAILNEEQIKSLRQIL